MKYILLKSQVNNSVYSFLFHTCENYPMLPLGLRIHLLPTVFMTEQCEWTAFLQRTVGSELSWGGLQTRSRELATLRKRPLGPHWTAWCYCGRQDDILAAFPENCRPTVWYLWRHPSCFLWAVYLKHTLRFGGKPMRARNAAHSVECLPGTHWARFQSPAPQRTRGGSARL